MRGGRRTVVAAVLSVLVLGVAAVLLLLPDSGKVIDVLGVVLAALALIVPLWVSRDSGARVEQVDLAGRLARVVRRQCDLDAEANQLNALEPMELRWSAASDLADRTGATVDGGLLSGRWSEVADQYRRVPFKRLVVLGGMGSGKSALMLHLMRSLLPAPDRKLEPGERVPVLFPMRSWDPGVHPHEWMATYLAEVYPVLQQDRAELTELVVERVLPILDGLDEMTPERQQQALERLNDVKAEFPYVLTCRPDDFKAAVTAAGRRLRRAAVVQLEQLSMADVLTYLQDVPHSRQDEWEELLSGIGPDDALAQALSTPLMVWLAGASYGHRPDELEASGQTREEITDHLLDELVRTAYAADPRWRPDDAQRYLTYLASYVLDRRRQTKPDGDPDDLAWWRLPDAAEPLVRVVSSLSAFVSTGGAFGLGFGALFGWLPGLLGGGLLGGFMGWASRRSRVPPTTVEMRLRVRLTVGLVAGLFIGVIAGASVWVATDNTSSALWALCGFGIPLGLVYGLTSSVDLQRATSPGDVVRRERVFVLSYTAAYGIACGTTGWVLADPVFGVVLGLSAGLAGGLFNGLPWLLVFGLFRRGEELEAKVGAVAWFRFLLAKLTWAGAPPKLPWRLMTFLADARRHGVLQQAGAVYKFRHGRLVERLAVTTTEASAVASPRR